jgi:hypothetical protein
MICPNVNTLVNGLNLSHWHDLMLSNTDVSNLIDAVNSIDEEYIHSIVTLSVLLAQKPELEDTVRELVKTQWPEKSDKTFFIIINAALTMR